MPSIIITTDGSHSLTSLYFQENYHSINGALEESRHVYIEAGLNYVLQQNKTEVKIFEIGFGTGLNAYLTLVETQHFASKILETQIIPSVFVKYCGIEPYPIEEEIFTKLNYPEILNYSADLFLQLHTQIPSSEYVKISENFSFSKIFSTVEAVDIKEKFDLIYFDAFAPTTQPELWSEEVLQKMYDSLNSGGVLVTYCAKGSFRRALKSVGFTVERLPGAAGKREMTRAIRI